MSANSNVSPGMHTAGIYADMTVDGPLIGTLVMIIDRAKNLPNRKTMGKQHPYCAARLGKEAKKTNTDVRGGQTPRWDQEIRFQVHDSPDYYNLKLSVFNDDKRTDLIGETWIDLRSVIVAGGGQNDAWHRLGYREKYAGEIRIEMSYYDSRAPAEGTLVGEGQKQSKPVKRRPLPGAPDSASSSPGPASAFGPRDMGSRVRESSTDQNVQFRAPSTHSVQDSFRHSVHGSFPPRSTTGSTFYADDIGRHHQYQDSYDSMQSDFLPRLPPKNSSPSTSRPIHMRDARSSPSQSPTHLAHHQSLPNVRLAQFDRSQRYSTSESEFRSRNLSYDDYDQSFHEPILEDDPADGIAPLPTPSRRGLPTNSPVGGSGRRALPSPTASSQYSPSSTRDDYYQRPSVRTSVAEESPSPRQRRSQVFAAASPTQPSPLRRELPANPATHSHPLRHAHSSSFSGPSHSEYYTPAPSHPPMNRHSVSDPYANVSPTRSHPLSYETRRSQSPQSYRSNDRAEDSPRYNSTNTPIFRPRAISPRPSQNFSPHDSSYSPQTRGGASPQHTPARRSVVGHGSPAASRDGMPFSPDSFDVHNPASRSSPLDHNVNPQKPFHVASSPSFKGLARESSEPILGVDGREVDPSDHLPVDVWAPEPEVKIPCKDYGSSDKGFGPRAAAPLTERPKRTSILSNVRSKLAGSSPTGGNATSRAEQSSPVGAGRTGASPVTRTRGQSDVLTGINAHNSYVKPQRYSGTSRNDSPIDGYGCSSPSALTHVDSRGGYRDYGYGTSALEQELSQIDLGVSSRRGTVSTRGGDAGPGHQYGSQSGQMQMYQQGPGARRSYDDARYGYR